MLRVRAGRLARHPLRSAAWIGTYGLIRAQTDGHVVDGPFAGMWFGLPIVHLPAYLGTYELELWPLLAELASRAFDVVVNVGAANGYYAVGLARVWPGARIVAFELEPSKRESLSRVALENGVDRRVRAEAECTPERLDAVVRDAECPLVWMDVDGAELDLLDPARAPGLRRAEIVVELHEFLLPQTRERLEARFSGTHESQLVRGEDRRFEQFPLRGRFWQTGLGRAAACESMQEGRPVLQDWLRLRPRARS